MIKIIFVSPFKDFSNDAEGIQTSRLFNTLSSNGLEIIAISDNSFKSDLFEIVSFRIMKLVYLLLKTLKRLRIPFVHEFLIIYDPHVVFNFIYIKKIRKMMKEIPNLILFTNSTPFSTHLIGLKLSKKPGVRWVARLSDPYSDNEYEIVHNKFLSRLQSNIEKSVFGSVDTLIVTSRNYKDYLIKKYEYPPGKIQHISHISNGEIKSYNDLKSNSKKGVYVGNLYGNRKLDTFLSAVNLTKSVLRDQRVSFQFYGRFPKKYIKTINRLGICDLIVYHGNIPQNHSPTILLSSDFFINIESSTKNNLFLPSKFPDYLVCGKPILNIASYTSESNNYLDNYNYSASPDDLDEICKAINSILRAPRSIEYDTSDFDSEVVFNKYSNLFKRLI